jgi:cytochrome c-type biogenesis protein CcmE
VSVEASTPAPSPEAPAPSPSTRRTQRPRLRLAVVGVVILGAVGFLLVKGLGSSLDYFKTVNEATAQKAQLGTETFRLEGVVEPGTVARTDTGASFDVQQGANHFHVINVGTPPQLFKATLPVIVVGHFASASSSTFLSNQIMVKHTSSYIAAHPNRVRAGNGTTN